LRLSEADRDDERDDAFDALARLMRNLLVHSPASLDAAVDEVFPWVTFLPWRERKKFVDDLSRTLVAASSIEHYAPVGQMLREWKATAELHADPRLARRLRNAITADGDAVPAPTG
jgi:hypothetical protein